MLGSKFASCLGRGHPLEELDEMIKMQDYGQMVQSGLKCLIIGRPNVGKSSLLNRFLGQDRSIVTSQAGTTRDFIDATIQLKGVSVKIFDTAGMRQAENEIEREGIEKIEGLIDLSDVVFWVCDGSEPFSDDDQKIYEKIKGCDCVIKVVNKSDKDQQISFPKEVEGLQSVAISAKSGEGIATLKQKIITECIEKVENKNLDLICNVRQLDCVKVISEKVTSILNILTTQTDDDLLSQDLRTVIQKCSELTGDEVTEEMLDGIFSRFCIGK